MAFIPVPDTAEVVMSYTGPNGNIMKNVFHVREAGLGTWDTAALTNVISIFQNWENTVGKAGRSNQITCTGILARDLSVVDSFVVDTSVNIVGTIANPALPANVTFCIKALTGLAGRSFRGRHYWIGLAETNVAGDYVTTGVGDARLAALNVLRDSINNALPEMSLVVVSKFHNGAPRAVGVATDILTYAITDYRVDTQRRRLIGEGQ